MYLLLSTIYALAAPESGRTCVSRSTPEAIHAVVDRADTAFASLDADAFTAATEELTLTLPCLSGLADPVLAARVHRLQGLRHYMHGQTEDAVHSLTAARALEPSFVFADDFLPPSHELRQSYESLDTAPPPTKRVSEPREGGSLYFDGTATLKRPEDRSTLYQRVTAEQLVAETRYLQATEPLPAYSAIPRLRNRLIFSSAASAALGVGAYALSWSLHNQFEDGANRAVLEDLQGRTNATFGVALGLGAVATGTGIAALRVGEH